MRLFLALDLPAGLRNEIERTVAGLKGSLGGLSGWRWARPEGVHLTLRFLGEVPEDAMPAMSPWWRAVAAAAAPIRLEVDRLGTFPSERVPRVLWLGVRDTGDVDGLATLAVSFEAAARQAGFEPEARSFRPHLTLARADGRSKPALPRFEKVVVTEPVELRKVTLFRSILGPGGAVHLPIEVYPLGEAR